jgi:hypothetical protein
LRRCLLLVSIFILVIEGLSTSSARAESRVALVIGNSAYASIGTLRNPVNDARAMNQALRSLGFEVTLLENASKAQIETGLRQFTQRLTPEAVSLVYYAGHGVQIGGRNYLIPVDARIETVASVKAEAVDLDEVLAQIGQGRSGTNIIILDACRDNPFTQPEMTVADGSVRRAPSRSDPRFRGISGGLASVNAPSGILIAYATAPGRVAADGSGANGLYTTALIRAMMTPGASLEVIFKQTRIEVMQQSGGRQTPWESSSLTIEFSFRPGRVAPPSLPQTGPGPSEPLDTTHGEIWEGTQGIWHVKVALEGNVIRGEYRCYRTRFGYWYNWQTFESILDESQSFSAITSNKMTKIDGKFPKLWLGSTWYHPSQDCPDAEVTLEKKKPGG